MTIGQIRNNAQKDLQRALRDPVGLLVWMGIPLVIGSLIALAFGGTDGPAPQAHVLVVDQDESFLSNLLLSALTQAGGSDGLIQTEQVELEEGQRRIDDGDGSALLVIPEGFGEAVLAEAPTTLRLTTNPAQTILPGIVEETLSILTDATFYLHRVLGDEIEELTAGPPDGGNVFDDAEIALISVSINQAITRLDPYLFPPVLELATSVDETEDWGEATNIAVLFLPGIMLISLLFMAQGLSEDVWQERQQGTLRRAVSTPEGILPLLGGKLLSGGVIILSITIVILTLGTAYLGLSFLNLPLAVLWTTFSGTVFLIGMILLQLYASSQRAGSILASSLVFPLLMIGGSFFPSEVMPAWMARVGAWTPNGMALELLKDILLERQDLQVLVATFFAMLAVGGVLFGLSARRLSRTFAAGA